MLIGLLAVAPILAVVLGVGDTDVPLVPFDDLGVSPPLELLGFGILNASEGSAEPFSGKLSEDPGSDR